MSEPAQPFHGDKRGRGRGRTGKIVHHHSTTRECNISEATKNNILSLLCENPRGLLGCEVIPRYRERFGEDFEYKPLGFAKLLDFLLAIPAYVKVVEGAIKPGGDFRAFVPDAVSNPSFEDAPNAAEFEDSPNAPEFHQDDGSDDFGVGHTIDGNQTDGIDEDLRSEDEEEVFADITSYGEIVDVEIQEMLGDPQNADLLDMLRKRMNSNKLIAQYEIELKSLQETLKESEHKRKVAESRVEILEKMAVSAEDQVQHGECDVEGESDDEEAFDESGGEIPCSDAVVREQVAGDATSDQVIRELEEKLEESIRVTKECLALERDPVVSRKLSELLQFLQPEHGEELQDESEDDEQKERWPHLQETVSASQTNLAVPREANMQNGAARDHVQAYAKDGQCSYPASATTPLQQTVALPTGISIVMPSVNVVQMELSNGLSYESPGDSFNSMNQIRCATHSVIHSSQGIVYQQGPENSERSNISLDVKKKALMELIELLGSEEMKTINVHMLSEFQIDDVAARLKYQALLSSQAALHAGQYPQQIQVQRSSHVPAPAREVEDNAQGRKADHLAASTAPQENGKKKLAPHPGVGSTNTTTNPQDSPDSAGMNTPMKHNSGIDRKAVRPATGPAHFDHEKPPQLFKYIDRSGHFGPNNILEGLELHEDFLTSDDEANLVRFVDEQLAKAMAEKLLCWGTFVATIPSKRAKGGFPMQLQYGVSYNYSSHACQPDVEVDPMPLELRNLAKALVDQGIVGINEEPNTAVINVYEQGDFLPPHVDSDNFSRPICTLSLLSDAMLFMGTSAGHVEVDQSGRFHGKGIKLLRRTVLVMRDSLAGNTLQHAVAPVHKRRISITFRRLKADSGIRDT